MSQLNDIINRINGLTGYNVPTSSNIIINEPANLIGSGSVNQIVDYINSLTGYNIPYTDVQIVSGSNVAGPVIVYAPYAAGGTIPTTGIAPGQVIKAEHVLRVINALNGVNVDDIIISGSLSTSGSNTLNGTLSLPFIEDGKYLYTQDGKVVGVDPGIESASYAQRASYADAAENANYALNALNSSYALSSSYSSTASYALNGLSGGTDSYIPLWSGSNALSSSAILQQSSSIQFSGVAVDVNNLVNWYGVNDVYGEGSWFDFSGGSIIASTTRSLVVTDDITQGNLYQLPQTWTDIYLTDIDSNQLIINSSGYYSDLSEIVFYSQSYNGNTGYYTAFYSSSIVPGLELPNIIYSTVTTIPTTIDIDGDLNVHGSITTQLQSGRVPYSAGGKLATSQLYQSNGKIGIGISDPEQKLDVNGSGIFKVYASGFLKLQGTSTNSFFQAPYGNLLWLGNNYYDGSNFRYDKAGYATQLQVETDTAGVFVFYVAPYGTAGQVVNSIAAMVIRNNGYVGLGKNTANAQLDVNGNAIISGSLRVSGSLIMDPSSSFVLPLSRSLAPQLGSAYWSGSLLFVYNGTKYMSASFA